MRPIIFWVACAVATFAAMPASAAEPLLVVVETDAGARMSADEARAAVASELDAPVVGPGEPFLATSSGTLIVHVGDRSARLTYEPQAGASRHREIALPKPHEERLKTVAWIALNLVKDQVGAPDDEGGVSRRAEPLPALEPPRPTTPTTPPTPPAPPPATAHPFGDTPTVGEPARSHEPSSLWKLGFFGGPTVHAFMAGLGWRHDFWRSGNEWQIEVTRSLGDFATGVALDMGEQGIPTAGLAAYVGDGWQWRRLRLEATLGAGLELTRRRVSTTHQHYDSSGVSESVDVTTESRPQAYGRGNLTLAYRLGRTLDVVLRLALHLDSDDKIYSYGIAMLGLRVNLP